MKLGNKRKDKNKDKELNNNKETNTNEIEVVMGDDSELNISDVGDYMNNLKPKSCENKKKSLVIPKSKKR